MAEVICIALVLAIMALICAAMIAKDKKRKSLAEDDGIVWNTQIEKRMDGKN